ncbi:NAD(P)/FAD-dependent oxidoreductase [Nocardia sp. NPDC005998]|uniref:FAD-dependent oxidoreductase n=1 Tax=Nocardia sp. NPDC005998 TaxID=3156894 RepID=UPI0033B2A62A
MTRRVLIIGAGLTGLALANGLRCADDIEITVVEQAPVITEAGWAISLTDRHLDALRQLGLAPQELTADRLARTIMYDPNTSVPVGIAAMDGVVTTRSELQLWLWEPVGELVRTGIAPVSITDNGACVEVGFSDGTAGEFDVVVGADGINSWTRRSVFGGPDPAYAGSAVVRFQVPNAAGLHLAGMTSDGRLSLFVLNRGTVLHGVVFLPGEPDNRSDCTLTELAEDYADLSGPLAGLIKAMRTEPVGFYANINQVVTDDWAVGRIALAGDAAHAMSPRLGQGAGVGLQDAALLSELLTLPDLPVQSALAGYAGIRRPAAQLVQQRSHAATLRIGHPGSALELHTQANL